MKGVFIPRKHQYRRTVGVLLIVVALLTAMVACAAPPTEYNLTMAPAPASGGTATDVTGTSPYASGTVVDIRAVAAAGYQFVGWTAPAGTFDDENAEETTFTMPAQDVIVTANFVEVYELSTAESPSGSGTATDQTNGSPYAEGTEVSIEAVPAAGYQFFSWTAPAGTFTDANAAETTFTMPAEDVTVTANFVGPLDHFTGYNAADVTGQPIGQVVYLEDQFGSVNATVQEVMGFGNPAEKDYNDATTPIMNPDHHLTIYNITCEEDPQTWEVEVDNQFGLQYLTVYGPVALVVPTQKVEPGGHGEPLGLDHFLLYGVVGGPSVNVVVEVKDQFGETAEEIWVYDPLLFANPVRKTHGEEVTDIFDPEAHAVIYGTDVVSLETQVQVINQFGEQTLDIYDLGALAVPSLKLSYELALE